jgi:hypothetical protein
MPPKSKSFSAGKHKAVFFRHFEANSRGKLVNVKRSRTGAIKSSQTVRIQASENSPVAVHTDTGASLQAYDFNFFTDDAGDAIFEEPMRDEPSGSSRIVRL